MSSNITQPVMLMVAVLIGLVVILALVLLLQTSGFGGAGTSTALGSTSDTILTLMPYIAGIIATGLVYTAMEHR